VRTFATSGPRGGPYKVTNMSTTSAPGKALPNDGTGLIRHDPWLEPYADRLRSRQEHYLAALKRINDSGGLLGTISQGHHYFGFNRGTHNGKPDGKPGVWYREWAPAAHQLKLIGDFNQWDRDTHPLVRDPFGTWAIFLPDDEYANRLVHGSKVKVHVVAEKTGPIDRLPAYIRRVVQEPGTINYTGVFWMPTEQYEFKHAPPVLPNPRLPDGPGLRIYEAHVGMATEEFRVGTFNEFTEKVLPRIKGLGYNAIQLMAIQEHPYYGSFGYHVSNFFAVSSRFGTPDDLKRLVDTAHSLGLLVIMDLVHSHAVKNTLEGLNLFDGTDFQYFHAGPKGHHVAWDSKVFDYSKYEVQRFLLSNVRYWLEEYRFDGFRFDGVTSMMYLDHGLGKNFTSYDDYFSGNTDNDAITYLQLANQLAHSLGEGSGLREGSGFRVQGSVNTDTPGPSSSSSSLNPEPRALSPLPPRALSPNIITIAEDMSGMPGLARPVEEGGLGFDYRLAMGVPDQWIKMLKEKTDEQWNLGAIYHTLLNRRFSEKHIGYAESHDQAMVGDKTLAFWLMDKEMYWHMDNSSQNIVIDRGIALHKMIRLITFSLAGEGYLNFMGNEFGHPEWIDFPREGNNWSYQYARRQWSLGDNPSLRYTGLRNFDQAMMELDEKYHVLTDPFIEQLHIHEENKQLIYRRGPLVFVFNFHASHSYTDWRIPVPDPSDYRVVLNTDAKRFAGPGLVLEPVTYPVQSVPTAGRQQSVQVYLPARSAQVLAPVGMVK
jgi:1,4-alpha-glucan branching enzyme